MKKIASAFSWILIGSLVCLAFWIRGHGASRLHEGQFTGADPYLYYWQADIISENGELPERDMHRWLPIGRDNQQTLNLYSYVLAYTYKGVAAVFENVSLYEVTLYTPLVCFCMGLAVLCIFLYLKHGIIFSWIVGILLATLPGSIGRSAIGFSDRDSWCWLLGVLCVTTYLISLQASPPRKRLFWTLTSGIFVFIGGMSWEGFGVFLTFILVVELWRFLASETESGFAYYFLWVVTFVPTLWIFSPAYRSGGGFTTHVFAFVLMPPIVLLGLRALRHLLLSKVEKLRPHARLLTLGLTLAAVSLAIGYVLIQFDTFAKTTVPLSGTPLMQAIGELDTPDLKYWFFRTSPNCQVHHLFPVGFDVPVIPD